jgi:muramidase (phage lysozyme)
VERWLGGPYSIPAYIVMCESGGNYSALNASSGAGGAYQILPSTWQLYGGQGEPQNASKQEQDRIAAEIWADSGSSAWVCG